MKLGMPLHRWLWDILAVGVTLTLGCGAPSRPAPQQEAEPAVETPQPVERAEASEEWQPYDGPFLLGAHYYMWFPENLQIGTLRGLLHPPQVPVIDPYISSDPSVAEQHIEWAADAGVDFFSLNYWHDNDDLNARIDQGFLQASNIERIKFCLFYGAGDLGGGYSAETLSTYLDSVARDQLVDDVLTMADKYFDHPSYLRIDGRPVVLFYTTRILVGQVEMVFNDARAALEERGFDPFFIGDEIFWLVRMVHTENGDGGPDTVYPVTEEPQVDRIRLFDAITDYNLIFDQRTDHAGHLAESTLIEDANNLFAMYRAAVPDVPLVPTIIPGYNDHGARPGAPIPVIPREASPGASVASGLALMYDEHLLPNLDARAPIAFITTWNEWNEDTMIEPVAVAPPATGEEFYTEGYTYEGHGMAYLDFLRSRRMSGDAPANAE